MKWLHMVAFLLLIVGGLNWGLIGAFHWNLVNYLLGSWPSVESVVYVLVGLSALWLVVTHKAGCRMCNLKGK